MRCNILQISYTIGYIILLSAILNVSSNIANLNKENGTNNSMENNDADIGPFQMFFIILTILLFTLIIMCLFHFYWNWHERQQKIEIELATLPYSRRYVRVKPAIELKNIDDIEQQRTCRTESCVEPSGERTEICNLERKTKRGSKSTYKSNKKPKQNRHQHKHENKREDEEKDESEDQQIWHTNKGYISDKEPLVPTPRRVLPKSAKTSASTWPGPSRRKSRSSGVSVNAIKITHDAEVYATKEEDD